MLRRLNLEHQFVDGCMPRRHWSRCCGHPRSEPALPMRGRLAAVVQTGQAGGSRQVRRRPNWRRPLALIAVMNGIADYCRSTWQASMPKWALVCLSEIGWQPCRVYHLEWSAIRPVTPVAPRQTGPRQLLNQRQAMLSAHTPAALDRKILALSMRGGARPLRQSAPVVEFDQRVS